MHSMILAAAIRWVLGGFSVRLGVCQVRIRGNIKQAHQCRLTGTIYIMSQKQNFLSKPSGNNELGGKCICNVHIYIYAHQCLHAIFYIDVGESASISAISPRREHVSKFSNRCLQGKPMKIHHQTLLGMYHKMGQAGQITQGFSTSCL